MRLIAVLRSRHFSRNITVYWVHHLVYIASFAWQFADSGVISSPKLVFYHPLKGCSRS